MSLSEMLKAIPELSKEDEAVLLRVGSQMQYMADLSNTDIFLDCPIGEGKSLVVAHAQPASGTTAYERDVTGEIATAEKEPAVFTAIAEGMPICDIKAETQEGRPVRQNVCPVKSEDGRVLGVLIREKDISEELIRTEKYEQ
ncbi:MAG: histidine kinase N-terminal domain-containing protein [Firmicutes bacterium]|nr:histidine kinase N-terminal domain-containing protein [Bacillota bacterium]